MGTWNWQRIRHTLLAAAAVAGTVATIAGTFGAGTPAAVATCITVLAALSAHIPTVVGAVDKVVAPTPETPKASP